MRKVIAAHSSAWTGCRRPGPRGRQERRVHLRRLDRSLFDDVMGQAMGRIFNQNVRPAPRPQDLRDLRRLLAAPGRPYRPAFTAARKYVATRTAEGSDLEELDGDPRRRVRRRAAQEGGRPQPPHQGSSDLVQTLLAKDLIDEITLLIFPVVLGSGKRFFGKGTIPANFTAVDPKISSTGVIIGNYRRAGAVRPPRRNDWTAVGGRGIARRERSGARAEPASGPGLHRRPSEFDRRRCPPPTPTARSKPSSASSRRA